jgi:hypothetical protein
MRRRLLGILSLLFASFLFAVPASAVNLPQCAPFPNETTEFVLIAQNNVIFELQSKGSGRVINGNVLVTNPVVSKLGQPEGTGFIKVGANLTVNGTLIANTIILPDAGATITHCIADVIVANTPAAQASCGTGFPVVGTPFTDFATAHPTCVDPPLGTLAFASLCSPAPAIEPCANAAGPLVVAEGATLTMPPAPAPFAPNTTCFGPLTLRKGAVLNLSNAGPWIFKSVKMESGARLIGTAGVATVKVNGEFATDPGAIITNIDLRIAAVTSAEVVKIFNNSILTNTVINAPFGKCHIHTGTDFQCSEACCKVLDVQPITAECEVLNIECVCPTNSSFKDNVSRECVCNAGFHAGPNNTCVPD